MVDFGHGINADEDLEKILKSQKVDNFVTAKLMLAMAYNQAFGIFDHLAQEKIDSLPTTHPDKKRPWAAIEIHEKEDLTRFTRLRKMLNIFVSKKIGDFFKIDVFQFMNSGEEMIKMMMDTADKYIKVNDTQLDEVAKNLKK